MARALKLIGNVYGRLTVTGEGGSRNKLRRWACQCECGKTTLVPTNKLTSGRTVSCGCRQKEAALENILKTQIQPRHGMTGTVEHTTWGGMIERCRPHGRYSRNYYDRGIVVCERWLTSFENFYADMGNRPDDKSSIDRIDVNKGYSPENCRWATAKEQQRNRQKARRLVVDGRVVPLMEIADEFGIKKTAAQYFYSVLKTIRQKYSSVDLELIENDS